MSKPQPILGHPSKSAAARALRDEGHSHSEIALRIDTNVKAIGKMLREPKRPPSTGADIGPSRVLARQAAAFNPTVGRTGAVTYRAVMPSRRWLHFSGTGETSQPVYAWSGTREMFDRLCARFPDASAGRLERVLDWKRRDEEFARAILQ